MRDAITIRPERAGDAACLSQVVRRADADVGYSDHREHLMVDALRRTDAYLPALSLLAEAGGEAVGHVLLTVAHIREGGSSVATLALAPLSVVPAFRRRGVGRGLVEAAHRKAKALGFASVVVVGPPAYYARFGYEPSARHRITPPFDVAEGFCMVLALAPGALAGVSGRIAYEPGWLDP